MHSKIGIGMRSWCLSALHSMANENRSKYSNKPIYTQFCTFYFIYGLFYSWGLLLDWVFLNVAYFWPHVYENLHIVELFPSGGSACGCGCGANMGGWFSGLLRSLCSHFCGFCAFECAWLIWQRINLLISLGAPSAADKCQVPTDWPNRQTADSEMANMSHVRLKDSHI